MFFVRVVFDEVQRMERHEEQREGTQPGGTQADVAQRLAELDRVLAGVRESIESIRASARIEPGAPAPAREAGGEGGGARPAGAAPAGGGAERQGPAPEPAAEAGPPQQARAEPTTREAGQGEPVQAAAAREPAGEATPAGEKGEAAKAAGGEETEGGEEARAAAGEEEEESGAGEEKEAAAGGEEKESGAGKDEEAAAGGEEKEESDAGKGATVALFDGNEASMGAWKTVGSGDREYRDEQLQLRAGRDRGLAYYTERRFDDFRLKARYRLARPDVPASAAVRFLDPEQPVPDREDPEKKYRYDNQAYVAAHTGFEVRLGGAGGDPGTLADIPIGDGPGQQRHGSSAEWKQDDWNELDLEVRGDDYTVRLNGVETARFTNTDTWRGRPARSGSDCGFVGFALGEPPRQGAHRPGPAVRPPGLAGPILPGRLGRGGLGGAGAPAEFDLAFHRIEVEVLGAAPQVSERDKKLARRDLAALHAQVLGALAKLKAKDQGLEELLARAYGYAVLPSVGRASLLLGGARGYGEVFEQGKPIGFTRMTQVTFGVQVGGQTFTKLILFGSKASLEAFKASPMAFNGNLSAVFIRGASGTTNFKDVTAHAYSRGGMLLEASLGGQKFKFIQPEQAAQELAKPRGAEARAKVGQAGRAAQNVAGTIASKVTDLFKKSDSKQRASE
jgi:lipid-binding SYLF domain-containing protein